MMGQMKQYAYRLAEYLYDEGLSEDQIIDELLRIVNKDEQEEAEKWLRQQIQYLQENPYPTRNALV